MGDIIGACGLSCTNCDAYKMTQANDAEGVARVAKQWCEEYGADIKPESVWCDGCLTDGARKCGHCGECDIRACAIEKNVENCAHCGEFACEKISGFMSQVECAKANLESIRSKLSS